MTLSSNIVPCRSDLNLPYTTVGRRRSFPRLRGAPEPRSPPSPFFPRAPEVPLSPTILSNSSHSSSSNSTISHWAVTVFEQAQSATPFRASGQVCVAMLRCRQTHFADDHLDRRVWVAIYLTLDPDWTGNMREFANSKPEVVNRYCRR